MASGVLLLVDALAVLYRSFFAIRDLSTADGRPTNALYGFVRKLRQMREHWQPSHLAVVFDGGLPEERTALLEEYKAQRPAMPDPLAEQLPLVDEYLGLAAVPSLRVAGEEADDVIATLACRAAGDARRVLVASGDKDLYQIGRASCRERV